MGNKYFSILKCPGGFFLSGDVLRSARYGAPCVSAASAASAAPPRRALVVASERAGRAALAALTHRARRAYTPRSTSRSEKSQPGHFSMLKYLFPKLVRYVQFGGQTGTAFPCQTKRECCSKYRVHTVRVALLYCMIPGIIYCTVQYCTVYDYNE